MVEERVIQAVRKIVDVYTSDEGTRYFRISWRDTWEPESHLVSCEEMLKQFWEDKKQKMLDDYNNEKDVNATTGRNSTVTCGCGAPIANTTNKRKQYVNAYTQCILEKRKDDIGTQTEMISNFDFSEIQVGRKRQKRKENGSCLVSTESDSGDGRIRNAMKSVLNMSVQDDVDVMSNEPTLYSESGDIQLPPKKTKTAVGVQVKSIVKSKSSQVVLKNVDFSVQYDTDVVDISMQAGPAFTHFKDESSQAGSGIMDHEQVSCQTYYINKDRSIQVDTSITNLKDDCLECIDDEDRLQREVSVQCYPLTSHCGIQTIDMLQRETGCQCTPTTSSCGVQNGGEPKMKEIMILTDVPLGLRSNEIIDESGRKENNTTLSFSEAVNPSASQSSCNVFQHSPPSASTPLVNSSFVVDNELKQSNFSAKPNDVRTGSGSKKVTFLDHVVSLDAYAGTNAKTCMSSVKRKLDTAHSSPKTPKTKAER